MPEWSLPLIGAAGIALLLVLVIRFKVQAFAALLVTALVVGLVAGLPLATIPAEGDQPEQLGVVPAIIAGMGGTLGSVAILVALGAMIGKIIELSGGAESLAGRFAHLLSRRINRAEMEMLPATREQFEAFGSGGTTTAAVGGSTTAGGTTAVAERTTTGGTEASTGGLAPGERAPSAGTVLTIVLVPLLLIMLGTVGATVLPEGSTLRDVAGLVGAPVVALLVALALAAFLLGVRRGWSAERLCEVMESSLPPAAVVILVTGAGGAFARVLTESGVGTSLSDLLTSLGLPLLVAAYLVSLTLRAAQGSATVAIITSAGLVAGAVAEAGLGVAHTALLTLAICFGALGLSHVNDSGFWVVTRYLGMSVADGLRRWTVLTTVLSLVGFGVVALLWAVVPG